MIEYKRSD